MRSIFIFWKIPATTPLWLYPSNLLISGNKGNQTWIYKSPQFDWLIHSIYFLFSINYSVHYMNASFHLKLQWCWQMFRNCFSTLSRPLRAMSFSCYFTATYALWQTNTANYGWWGRYYESMEQGSCLIYLWISQEENTFDMDMNNSVLWWSGSHKCLWDT